MRSRTLQPAPTDASRDAESRRRRARSAQRNRPDFSVDAWEPSLLARMQKVARGAYRN